MVPFESLGTFPIRPP